MTPFHIVGCVLSTETEPDAIEECLEWARRLGAEIISEDQSKAVFVRFDSNSGQLILFGCRAALARKPPVLRFGYASAVKEGGAGGHSRAGERSIAQASDLAAAALPGQVLLSSQLGSLLQMSQAEPYQRLRSKRVMLPDGRAASTYEVEPLRGAPAADLTSA